MPQRFLVGARFELFLALSEVLRPDAEDTLWLRQARRKLDPATRRRMDDLARTPTVWLVLAAVPGMAALDGDSDAVIAALADLPVDAFAARCGDALRAHRPDAALERLTARLERDAAGLQAAAVDALRRFDRLAFAAFWRRAQPDLDAAAQNGAPSRIAGAAALVFPTMFGEHRFQFGDVQVLTVPAEHFIAPPLRSSVSLATDPAVIFRALGDTTRYAIARLIAREALTGAELARRLGVSGPTLTHHLKALRQARLVIEERRGNSILLSLDRRSIDALSGIAAGDLFGAAPVAIRRSRRG